MKFSPLHRIEEQEENQFTEENITPIPISLSTFTNQIQALHASEKEKSSST